MIVKQTLSNGLRVITEQIPHVRSVALGIWIGTGSQDETLQNNGISHFIEHMMFKGTQSRTARQLAEAFDEIGGHVNAFTAKEMTCYYTKVLDEHFATSLEILADMFFNSTFLEAEIEKEKKVIIEEIRMVEDAPDDLIHDLLYEASLEEKHSLSYPILGSIENVQGFQQEDLFQYMDQFYNPHNVVIAIAGNLPHDYLKQIEALFSRYTGEPYSNTCEQPVFTPGMKIKQKSTEQSHICIGLPGLSVGDPRIYTLVLLNNVLGGNMSSRLFQEIREEHGLAYSVYSYHSAHRETGVFSIYAGTAHGQEDEVCELIQETLIHVRDQGLTSKELKKAKEQLKGSMMLGLESTNNRMSRIGRNEILLGKHLSLDEMIESIEKISLDEVNQLAREIFSSQMSLALISPTGKEPATFRRNNLV